MMRLLPIIFFLLLPLSIICQDFSNILCYDFRYNGEPFSKGEKLRKVFESVLSNLENPPVLVERNKLNELFKQLETDRNLIYDLGAEEKISTFNTIQADYLIYGDFRKDFGSELIEFQSEIISISKENFSAKLSFPVKRFPEKDLLDNSVLFEQKIKKMLGKYSFPQGMGIIETKQLEEIKREISEKDNQIRNLTNELAHVKTEVFKLDSIESSRALENEKDEKLKHTPPKIRAKLILKNKLLLVRFQLLNDVPIQYNKKVLYLVNGKYKDLRNITVTNHPAHPDKKLNIFDDPYIDLEKTRISKDSPTKLSFKFQYNSIYMAEMNDYNLGGKINQTVSIL